jgi:hypothetical protein
VMTRLASRSVNSLSLKLANHIFPALQSQRKATSKSTNPTSLNTNFRLRPSNFVHPPKG